MPTIPGLPEIPREHLDRLTAKFSKLPEPEQRGMLVDMLGRAWAAYEVVSPHRAADERIEKGVGALEAVFDYLGAASGREGFSWREHVVSGASVGGIPVVVSELALGASRFGPLGMGLAAAALLGVWIIGTWKPVQPAMFAAMSSELASRVTEAQRAAPTAPPPAPPERPRRGAHIGTGIAAGAAAGAGTQLLAGAVAVRMVPKETWGALAIIALVYLFTRRKRQQEGS